MASITRIGLLGIGLDTFRPQIPSPPVLSNGSFKGLALGLSPGKNGNATKQSP